MPTMSLTAFVTGASGFVGSNLVRELHARDWKVHVLVRPTSSLDLISGLPITVHSGDVTDRNSLTTALPENPDAVFHVAASTNFWSRNNDAQDRVNIDGTGNLVEAAIAAGARRFIHTSSFVTWGFGNKRINEQSERNPETDWINYVRSKHLAEQVVLQAVKNQRLDAVILNPAHILGPGDQHNWSRMIRMVEKGKLFAAPPGSGNFCDVREVARAHVSAFHSGRRGEKYLLGGEYAAFADVVRVTGNVLGRRVPRHAAPAWVMKAWARAHTAFARLAGRVPDITPESAAMVCWHVECDSAKAQRELDYRFTPIPTLIEATADWMKKKGLLS
jgi:nucleoside-diphosphate-sugar epimerase